MEKEACVALIDIGSHSVKLVIAEPVGGDVHVLESLKHVIPIGNDTFCRDRLGRVTVNRVVGILDKYRRKIGEYGLSRAYVFATTAVREADNRNYFLDVVRRRTGFEVTVLSAGDVIYHIDAYLQRKLKDRYPVRDRNLLIADLGAGSLDVSVMARGLTVMNTTLPLGTLRVTQSLGTLDGSRSENFEALGEIVSREIAYLARELPRMRIDDIMLIDETHASFLSGMIPGSRRTGPILHITENDTRLVLEKVLTLESAELSELYGLPPETTEIFPAYALIIKEFAGLSRDSSLSILNVSLAQAVLAEILLGPEHDRKYDRTGQLVSLATAICKKYRVDLRHARQVAKLSAQLFRDFAPALGLAAGQLVYLLLAAYLHDIGAFIFNRGHHKHTEYVISCLHLFRLSEEEIRLIACIGRYHRGGEPQQEHELYATLSGERQILVQKLGAILRLANALDRSHRQKADRVRLEPVDGDAACLAVRARGNFVLERTAFREKKGALEVLSGLDLSLKVVQG